MMIQLRNIPNSTGHSSYDLMLERKIRTMMAVLNEIWEEDKRLDYDQGHRILNIGERVQARN